MSSSVRAVRGFRAMGTGCEVIVDAAGPSDALADLGVQRVELLEQCWSRFRPASELSRLNARAGTGPIDVSADLLVLIQAMRQAWERSDGLFDPTVLQAVRAAGYDADFAAVIAREAVHGASAALDPRAPQWPVQATHGMGDIRIDVDARTVTMPTGVGLDPGAIGKGLAGDLIAGELLAAGATGVLVNLGGDISFAGDPGSDPAWTIAVDDERLPADAPDRAFRWFAFEPSQPRGAVATSTTLKRQWGHGRHHVIDPRTGQVADVELVQATVVADEGWWAEAAATAALLLGPERAARWLDEQELSYVLVTGDSVLEPGASSGTPSADDCQMRAGNDHGQPIGGRHG
ncbi:MAG: FAD:protein FMN transferase [Actinomycetales bacterium]|nr:FAD:protein FMN transferase [Actinomycetales bacterium]